MCCCEARGLGISVLPELAQLKDDKLLSYVPFDKPVPSRRVVMAWHKSFPRVAAIEVLRKSILALDLKQLRFWPAAQPLVH